MTPTAKTPDSDQFEYTIPDDLQQFVTDYHRVPGVMFLVDEAADLLGCELNRWALIGFHHEYAGETLSAPREQLVAKHN